MRIKIITAILNNERYVGDFLESITSQSGYRSGDLLVVDGCSTDGTVEILAKNHEIEYTSEPDTGQSSALNKAIDKIDSSIFEYTLIMDSDDILFNDALKIMRSAISSRMDIYYGHTIFIDKNSNIIKKIYSVKFNKNFIKYGIAMPPSCGLLIRTKLLKKIKFDQFLHYNMDTDFFMRLPTNVRVQVLPYFIIGFRMSEYNKTSKLFFTSEPAEQHKEERNILRTRYNFPRKGDWLESIVHKWYYYQSCCLKLIAISRLMVQRFD